MNHKKCSYHDNFGAIILLVSFLPLLIYKLHILFADSVRGKAEIQCRFPAILPSDQIFDICFFHRCFDCLDSIVSDDLARYICVLSGILAHWMGDTTGALLLLSGSFSSVLYIVYSCCCLTVHDLIFQIAQACKPLARQVGLWGSVRALARAYEIIMGVLLFTPITIFAWFPFVSEFQTRMLFNQAFSRGLQISRILGGQKKERSSRNKD